jgi:hypothetical protein
LTKKIVAKQWILRLEPKEWDNVQECAKSTGMNPLQFMHALMSKNTITYTESVSVKLLKAELEILKKELGEKKRHIEFLEPLFEKLRNDFSTQVTLFKQLIATRDQELRIARGQLRVLLQKQQFRRLAVAKSNPTTEVIDDVGHNEETNDGRGIPGTTRTDTPALQRRGEENLSGGSEAGG